jgi:putative membrane protein
MRLVTLISALAIAAGSAGLAVAQTPAVKNPNVNNPAAPVPGANSFTESQAKSRIEANGYTNVTGLKKDDSGIWTGTATKDGRQVNVRVDFQGNVVTR